MQLDEAMVKRLKFAGLTPVHYELYRFSTFKQNGSSDRVLKACKAFVSKGREHYFLTLLGGCGLGKTHLAIAIINEIMDIEEKKNCYYAQTEILMDLLRSKFNHPYEERDTFESWFNFVKNVPYLVLDDLGVQQDTAWSQAKLEELIDSRYFYQMATIFTSNLSPQQLPPRITSRLMAGVCVLFEGKDYRIIQSEKRMAQAK